MAPLVPNDQPAPLFTLPALDGSLYRLESTRGCVLILNFWSAECPWSERADRELGAFLAEWDDELKLWSIASNANEHDDLLVQVSRERGLPLVLRDAQQQVADQYGALTTPHFFLVDLQGLLRYQGALDDITFRQRAPTRFYLRQAVEVVLAGRKPDPALTPPYGCTIVRYQP